MGSRYSVLIANGGPTLEQVAMALSATKFAANELRHDFQFPEGKLEPDDVLWFTGDEWVVMIIGYTVGATAGADATNVARALARCPEVRYFCREDTNGELYAQYFVNGVLHFSHCEVEGTAIRSRQQGLTPAKDRSGQTNRETLLASLLPPNMTLSNVASPSFVRFTVQWRDAPEKKKAWWPWRRQS